MSALAAPVFAGSRCAQADPDLFFPEPGQPVTAGRAVCLSGCPALAECRAWALSEPNTLAGIWGGLTGAERRAAKRERLVAA